MMNRIDYDAMSDRELKQYFLAHRQEESAFQAFLARSRSQPRTVITKVGDADFDSKLQSAINQKMQAHKIPQDNK